MRASMIILFSLGVIFNRYFMDSMQSSVSRVYLNRFTGHCRGYEKAPITYENVSFQTNQDGLFTISYLIMVKRNVTSPLKYAVHVVRCQNKENLGTCEKFRSFYHNDFCTLLDVSASWLTLINAIRPKFRCPFRKGIYVASNSSLVTAPFLAMDDWYWKFHHEIRDVHSNEMILCNEIYGGVYRDRTPTDKRR